MNEKFFRINFDILNNGDLKWIKNKIYLKLEDNDYFISDKINLPSLNKGEKIKINLTIKKKIKLQKQKYVLKLNLMIENQVSGNPIEIYITVK